MPHDHDETLVVAILTFRRPDRIAALLPRVAALCAEVDLPRVAVLVVDNDPQGSAREAVQAAGIADLRYVVEPRPGIASARHRAVVEAADFDLFAFLDDDELPQPGWLAELVATWRATQAAAVVGRRIAVFPDGTDPWVLASGLFRRRNFATGTRLEAAASASLLLDLAQVRALDVNFDPRLGLAGGEDTLFSRQLVQRGGRIVWCQESVTEDHVPAERLDRRWALRRAKGHGATDARVAIMLADKGVARWRTRVEGIVGGALRWAFGVARWLLGVLTRDLGHRALGMRMASRGRGMLVGSLGRSVTEYERPDELGD